MDPKSGHTVRYDDEDELPWGNRTNIPVSCGVCVVGCSVPVHGRSTARAASRERNTHVSGAKYLELGLRRFAVCVV